MKKLLLTRYFSATGRRITRLLIAMPALGVAAFLLLLFSRLIPASSTALQNGLTAVFFALALAFALLWLLCEIRLSLTYYRTLFGKESAFYLSLPTRMEDQLIASVGAGVLWQLILLLVAAFTVTVGMLLPFELLLRAENVSFLSSLMRSLFDTFTPLFPLAALLAPIALLLLVYAAITVGSVFFPRKRALGQVLFLSLAAVLASLLSLAASGISELLPDALLHLPYLLVSLLLVVACALTVRKAVGKHIA